MDINEIFGTRVFDDSAMRAKLPERVYKSLKETMQQSKPLDPEIAGVVAAAMKNWAVSQGATHFTHWFQPLNNFSAGKHDAFISHVENGKVILEFSSSELVRGEPDASSFPSGGLRNTFEARGYTTWDPTSPAFVRDGTLYIPTAFCSYTGEALDTKTPLLRSMQALEPQAKRILKALGYDDSCAITPTVGAEQEYFLVDRELYEKRLDLKLCGRTLLGAKAPKGQELDDHYCARIRLRVSAFMQELDEELWKFGVIAKTKHNEAAPAQHELAPLYDTVNVACDHNLLTMEIMRVTAKKHGLACLLHEKPFADVNGSGKHNNYSIATDRGLNFLSPGQNPEKNLLFLVTMAAMIEAVESYADLLRLSAASAGNDARLGGHEAPPAIISIFLGEALTDLLKSVAQGVNPVMAGSANIDTGVSTLSRLKKDDSDRNRTSPFAFTGNKFEFRMIGASQSIAFANTVLNTTVADCFARFADRLENCLNNGGDVEEEVAHIVADTLTAHGRVIFNGNNYTPEWAEEAQRRGLPILNSTVDAAAALVAQKNIDLFARHGIFREYECHARYDIMLESFAKVSCIEAETMLQMVRREIYYAGMRTVQELSSVLQNMESVGVSGSKTIRTGLSRVAETCENIYTACEKLETELETLPPEAAFTERARRIQARVLPVMRELRTACDELEVIAPADVWPMPTYTDLMYRI